MTFPTTAVPVVVEIAPGADPAASPGTWAWEDITTSVRLQDRISIVTGRQNEASLIDPARCTMRLDNSTGDFTPRNPLGQWYGSLGRNTPLRVRILRGQDTFGRTDSNGWGTADSGQAWTVSGSAAADYSVSSGAGRVSHGTSNVLRRSVLDVALADVEQMVDLSTPVLITGAALVTGVLARYQDSSNYYWLRVEFDKDSTDVVLKVSKCVAGSLSDVAVLDPVPGLTYAAGVPLRLRAQVLGNTFAMKVWTASGTEPSGWQLEATDDALTAAGGTGLQSWVVAGNTNTLPLVVSHDNYTAHVDRFCGFVSSWPPRWDPTGNDSTVPIQADGVLRRLSQGSPPSRSPLRRALAAAGPVAYWPGEDGSAATQLASAFAGHPGMAVSGTAEFVPVADLTGFTVTRRYGTAALVNLASGARLSAPVPGSVTTATGSAWTFAVRADVDAAAVAANFVILEWTTPGGTYVRWQLTLDIAAGLVRLFGINSAGTSTTITSDNPLAGLASYSVSAVQNGGNIDVNLRGGFGSTVSVAGTLTGVASVSSNTTGITATSQTTVGHITVWNNGDTPPFDTGLTTDEYGQTIFDVGLSAIPEPAHARLSRLCGEDGVAVSIPAVPVVSATRMGWQPVGTPLDLYRQCETADVGVLYELGFGLGYLPRDARYNRPVTLALDYAAGQIAPPFEPVDDDQFLQNRVTVRRIDGSSATAEDTASIASAGPYDGSVDVSLSSDSVLPDHAGWRLHLDTSDEMRWPTIQVNLARSPELVDGVLSCRVQSRATVGNPPPQVVGDDIDVLVEGYAETIGHKDWLVSFNTSPAAVWDVATADGDQVVPADGSSLAADVTAGGTTLLLSSTVANGTWTQDAADFPLSMRVGGERVTASTITAGLTDTFTRTTSNGWGTADSGQAWTILSGTTANFSTNGTTGVMSLTPVNSVHAIGLQTVDYGTVDFTVSVLVTVTPTGNHIYPQIRWWVTDANNYYRVEMEVRTDSTVRALIVKRVGGVNQDIGSFTTVPGLTHSTTIPIMVRIQSDDSATSNRKVKVWRSDSTEPNGWFIEATDASLTHGYLAVGANLASGNTNGLPVAVRFDDLTVANPQLVTLSARSVNGVNRAWSAGTEVDVWQPAIVAL